MGDPGRGTGGGGGAKCLSQYTPPPPHQAYMGRTFSPFAVSLYGLCFDFVATLQYTHCIVPVTCMPMVPKVRSVFFCIQYVFYEYLLLYEPCFCIQYVFYEYLVGMNRVFVSF